MLDPDSLLLAELARRADQQPGGRHPPVTMREMEQAESALGFELPSLLRRIFLDVADGGFGPGFGLLRLELGEPRETLVGIYTAFAGAPEDPMPDCLLPICHWGCSIWSCLDCRTEERPIVTMNSDRPLANAGRTLHSWLQAWLDGVKLWDEMFERTECTGINPFTKQPIEYRGQGNPKGTPWP